MIVNKTTIAVDENDDDEDNKPLRRRKHDPRVTYLADKVAYFRSQFRKSDHRHKSFVLAKGTTATPELIRTIPNVNFLEKHGAQFPRKPLRASHVGADGIACFVALFQVGTQQTARAMFRR